MSKNRNRAKLNKAQNGREYYHMVINDQYPMYWDDGIIFYPSWRKGYKNPNKRITMYKVREYKTWKHNRKTQYKNGKE